MLSQQSIGKVGGYSRAFHNDLKANDQIIVLWQAGRGEPPSSYLFVLVVGAVTFLLRRVILYKAEGWEVGKERVWRFPIPSLWMMLSIFAIPAKKN